MAMDTFLVEAEAHLGEVHPFASLLNERYRYGVHKYMYHVAKLRDDMQRAEQMLNICCQSTDPTLCHEGMLELGMHLIKTQRNLSALPQVEAAHAYFTKLVDEGSPGVMNHYIVSKAYLALCHLYKYENTLAAGAPDMGPLYKAEELFDTCAAAGVANLVRSFAVEHARCKEHITKEDRFMDQALHEWFLARSRVLACS
jgi:hypothetical protein